MSLRLQILGLVIVLLASCEKPRPGEPQGFNYELESENDLSSDASPPSRASWNQTQDRLDIRVEFSQTSEPKGSVLLVVTDGEGKGVYSRTFRQQSPFPEVINDLAQGSAGTWNASVANQGFQGKIKISGLSH